MSEGPLTNRISPSRHMAVAMLTIMALTIQPGLAAESSWNSDYARGLEAESAQQPAQAEASFRKALDEMQHEPHKTTDQEACLRKLGDALMLRNKTREAQSIYQYLLNLLTKNYGANSTKVAPILIVLGSIQESLGDHTSAMSFYQRALNINEKNYGRYSPEFAGTLHSVGRASYRAGDTASANKHYKKALSILSQEAGLNASQELKGLLKDYNDLIKGDDQSDKDLIKTFDSDIYGTKTAATPQTNSSGSTGTANSAWSKENAFQLKAQTQQQVNDDPQIMLRGIDKPGSDQNLAPVFKTMSDTIFNQSHFEKGEEYYKRKIAIDVDALGPNHPSVANDLSGLAVFYMLRQNYALAKPLLARALPIYEKAWGESNLLTVNASLSLASCEFHLGNTEAAAALYRQALSHGNTIGPNSLETARALNDMAYLYFHQGKLQEACTFYEWALASTEKAVGPKDPLLAACLKDYAQVLSSLGRTDAASAAESKAESILSSVH